jgi:hypothetical protein
MAIETPYPIFYDNNGNVLAAGNLYIGEANKDPESYPISVYYDTALTKLAEQPIRTINGNPSYDGSPTQLYVSVSAYSMTIQDRNGDLVKSIPSINTYEITVGADFDSTTNSGEFPENVESGYLRPVTETFVTGTASGSLQLFEGDYILANKISAGASVDDWDVLLGKNSRSMKVDFESKNLLINVASNTTVTATADRISMLNSNNMPAYVDDMSETFDTEATGALMAGTTEKDSHWYHLWISVAKNGGAITWLMVPDLASTADGDTTNKLIDSAADFVTDLVQVGDELYNLDDNTKGYVGAVDDLNTISCVDADDADLDLFPDGDESYAIHLLTPTGLSAYKANIGAVYNDAGSDLDYSRQEDKNVIITRTTALSAGTSAAQVAIDLSAIVPITAKRIFGNGEPYVAAGTASESIIYPFVASTYGEKHFNIAALGNGAAELFAQSSFSLDLPNKQRISYKKSSGTSFNLYITGYSI